jgi:hypothetical protein
MKKIKLTNSKEKATVDDWNFDKVNKHSWYAYKKNGKTYAATNIIVDGVPKRMYMHNLVMNLVGPEYLEDLEN